MSRLETDSLKGSLPGNAVQRCVCGTPGSNGKGDGSSSAVFILEIGGEGSVAIYLRNKKCISERRGKIPQDR